MQKFRFLNVMSLSPTQPSVNPQSPAQGKDFDPNLGPVADSEGQMPNEKGAVVTKVYTQVLGGKGICSPGLSDTGMYHRMSVY
jgi:hypothetical protein